MVTECFCFGELYPTNPHTNNPVTGSDKFQPSCRPVSFMYSSQQIRALPFCIGGRIFTNVKLQRIHPVNFQYSPVCSTLVPTYHVEFLQQELYDK